MIVCSLSVSSVLGDVFIVVCTVSRVKSKRFHGKVNSGYFCWFLTVSPHARAGQPEPEFWIIPEPAAPVPLDKGNVRSGNEIVVAEANLCNAQPIGGYHSTSLSDLKFRKFRLPNGTLLYLRLNKPAPSNRALARVLSQPWSLLWARDRRVGLVRRIWSNGTRRFGRIGHSGSPLEVIQIFL